MTIDELITFLLRYVNTVGGSLYTSTKLRYNPNVCHAACEWFLEQNRKRTPILTILTQLDTIDKETMQQSQRYVGKGPSMPSTIVKQIKSNNPNMVHLDVPSTTAIKFIMQHHSQPTAYSTNINTLIAGIRQAMQTTADRIIIYLNGDGGHVICVCRHVGGILIYDPNIGVISLHFLAFDEWGGMLSMILQWYRDNMNLNQFGFLQKY